MNGLGFAFLVLPSIAAVAVGWAVRHWALAAAVIAGGLGWLFLVPSLPGGARFITPFFTGAAVAGLVLLPALIWRPGISVWSRMTLALGAAFAAHLVFLQHAMAAR